MKAKSLKQKLILGTVQLGLPYGINNSAGKPDQHEVEHILDKAWQEGICLLDSADAYGESLQVIGAYLKKKKDARLEVISKFGGQGPPVKDRVNKTLSILGRAALWGYMYHRFTEYRSGEFRRELQELKESGKIKRIGVSLYSNEELEVGVQDPDLDIIQVPFNPLDASQKKLDLFAQAKDMGKEIHVRSVFLQGLFFKRADQLTGNLKEFSHSLGEIGKIAMDYRISVRELCLNFALHTRHVDRVVVGVETVHQLDENIRSINPQVPDGLLAQVRSLPGVGEALLNPSTWKP